MNRAAIGVGPWLLQQRARLAPVSLDATTGLLEQESYAAWMQAEQNAALALEEQAFLSVVEEAWNAALSPQEQQVLTGIFNEGKSASAVGRVLGMHHSKVGRFKESALEKLRGRLEYVLRYRALLAKED
jgi:DNA-directed RNA polymerase specialized sigma subunit